MEGLTIILECSEIIKEQCIDIPKLEQFMFKVFNDCKTYLKDQFNLNFPNMQLAIIYKKEEYAELLKKQRKSWTILIENKKKTT